MKYKKQGLKQMIWDWCKRQNWSAHTQKAAGCAKWIIERSIPVVVALINRK